MQSAFLPILVLIGGAFGLAIGVFSPFLTSVIGPFGDIYVRLMEVVVLPYLVSSLILGLGQLSPSTAMKLLRKSWLIYLLLWGASFTVIILMAFTVPLISQPAVVEFDAPIPLGPGAKETLVDLLVPNNLFQALSQNYIPSVVLMGVIFGIAVQRSDKPTSLLAILKIVQRACVRIWGWIVYLAPLGVCALFATSISTMSLTGYATMSIYVVVVCLSALILALWVLPMLLTVFLPLRYWEILSSLRMAFILSIVTSLSVAALPMIQAAAESFARRHDLEAGEKDQKEIIETSLTVSYPLAQLGNFFILIFLFYAAFFYSIHLLPRQILEIPFVTLLSGVGSPTSSIGAVTFMAEWLGMPPTATNLYIETMSITRYAQVVASVSGFAFVTLLVTFAFYGKLRFNLRAFVLTVAVSAAALFGVWSIGKSGGTYVKLHSDVSYLSMGLPKDIQSLSDANSPKTLSNVDPERKNAEDRYTLERIQQSGTLRVGYNAEIIPFAYKNSDGRLIGFDVELIYRFAQSMNVDIEFTPFEWQQLKDDLASRKFDIAISGIYITDSRLDALTVSDPYYQSPFALIVRSERVPEFASRKSIASINDLTIAVFDDPILVPLAKRSFPSAKIRIIPNYNHLSELEDVDAAIWTLAQAKAWAISHEGFSAVVPKNTAYRFLFGYLMPPNSGSLAEYLNYWMRQEQRNGIMDDMKRRWIDPAIRSPQL